MRVHLKTLKMLNIIKPIQRKMIDKKFTHWDIEMKTPLIFSLTFICILLFGEFRNGKKIIRL
jgi:hypothetical protein